MTRRTSTFLSWCRQVYSFLCILCKNAKKKQSCPAEPAPQCRAGVGLELGRRRHGGRQCTARLQLHSLAIAPSPAPALHAAGCQDGGATGADCPVDSRQAESAPDGAQRAAGQDRMGDGWPVVPPPERPPPPAAGVRALHRSGSSWRLQSFQRLAYTLHAVKAVMRRLCCFKGMKLGLHACIQQNKLCIEFNCAALQNKSQNWGLRWHAAAEACTGALWEEGKGPGAGRIQQETVGRRQKWEGMYRAPPLWRPRQQVGRQQPGSKIAGQEPSTDRWTGKSGLKRVRGAGGLISAGICYVAGGATLAPPSEIMCCRAAGAAGGPTLRPPPFAGAATRCAAESRLQTL